LRSGIADDPAQAGDQHLVRPHVGDGTKSITGGYYRRGVSTRIRGRA